MAKIPTMISESLPTPETQRTTQGYESQLVPNAQFQSGQQMREDALDVQKKQDRDAVLDAQDRSNAAKKKIMDTLYGDGKNAGLFSFTGGAAIGTEEKYSKSFEDIKAQAMNGVQNPRAQKALAADLDALNLSHLDNVKRFEMTQRKGYTTDLTSAKNDLDAQRAGLEFNNQKTMDDLLASAEKTGETAAKLKGAMPGDAIWKQEVLNSKSRVLSSQLLAMSRSKDTATLLNFSNKYEEYRKSGALTLDAVEKFDQLHSTLAPKINAAKAMGEIYGKQIAFQAPPQKLYDAVASQESGGQHFGGPGSIAGPNEPTTSRKGAKGLMQITPETALHLAGGVKSAADDILKDPVANRVAGEKYLDDLTKQFGDQRMALAAYNAGPTIVQDWMNGTNKSGKNKDGLKIGDPAKGEVTVDQFLAQVPYAETRNYVGKVLRTAGYAGRQGTIDEDTARAYAASMDEQSAAEFMKSVKQNNEAFVAQTKADVNGTAGAIVDALTKSGGNWDEIPLDVIAHAKENGSYNAIKDYDPKKPSNKAVVSYLYGLDAKELQAADIDSPDIRGGLSPEDYGRWKKKKEAITSSSAAVTHELRKSMVEKAMAARGIKTGGNGDEGDENRARVVRVNNLIDLQVDAFAQNNDGRMPSPSEMQKMVDTVFIDQKIDLNPGLMRWSKDRYVYDITLDDIPEDDVKTIRKKLNDAGIADTDARVIDAYLMAGPDTRSEARKEVGAAIDAVAAVPGAVAGLYDKTKAAGRYVMDSSAARSVGDYLSVFGPSGSIGTDPRNMTQEQKDAIFRVTGSVVK